MELKDLINELEGYTGLELLKRQIHLFKTTPFEEFTSSNADMLLFQFGCYDWGEGEFFELDVTRQLSGEPDSPIEQLHCTISYPVNDSLLKLGEDNFWCENRFDVAKFESRVLNHDAFQLCIPLKVNKSEIEVECV